MGWHGFHQYPYEIKNSIPSLVGTGVSEGEHNLDHESPASGTGALL